MRAGAALPMSRSRSRAGESGTGTEAAPPAQPDSGVGAASQRVAALFGRAGDGAGRNDRGCGTWAEEES